MKTWVIPVSLIVFVLVGGFVIWMMEGAPTYPSDQIPHSVQNYYARPMGAPTNFYRTPNPNIPRTVSQGYSNSSAAYQGTEKAISGQAESFNIDASVQGEIKGVREVFPSSSGGWQSSLYYGQNTMLTSGGGLIPGNAKLFVDVQLKNTSRSETISINFPTMFKLEDDGATIYDDRATSNNTDSRLTLLPLQSATESIWFTIPSSTQKADFWYGPDAANFINGFTIDFATGKIVPFQG